MNDQQARDLRDYLHANIPLSAAMAVSVVHASTRSVTLAAPLEPNINHKSTVFGGSAAAVAVLAAWSLLHLRLTQSGFPAEIVIQSSEMHYDRPITGAFTATSSFEDDQAWAAFTTMLQRRKRARLEIHAVLASDGDEKGRLSGRFVAFLRETPHATTLGTAMRP